ncbi:MAG: hypothetical protein M3Q08_01910 [Pseudomonadota bacterium]|nr:hypothetical protein [Pseudomonadota bacterium]
MRSSAAAALGDHPSPKNVQLIEDAITDVTNRGDIVLDPFLGSGTAIIAAENTGRNCYGLELDPKYLEVCINRWQQLTGEEAIHDETGLPFSELAALRRKGSEAGA